MILRTLRLIPVLESRPSVYLIVMVRFLQVPGSQVLEGPGWRAILHLTHSLDVIVIQMQIQLLELIDFHHGTTVLEKVHLFLHMIRIGLGSIVNHFHQLPKCWVSGQEDLDQIHTILVILKQRHNRWA